MIMSDGKYNYYDLTSILDNDFLNENELCDYIELNMDLFVSECLGKSLLSYKREYRILGKRIKRGARRIDFLINTKCGNRIGIECKSPKDGGHELTNAIGQCFGYLTMFNLLNQPLDFIVIVSTKIDDAFSATMMTYDFPIGVIYFDKSKHIYCNKVHQFIAS